jgi:hypothetical protein
VVTRLSGWSWELQPVAPGREGDLIRRHLKDIVFYKNDVPTADDIAFCAWSLGGDIVAAIVDHDVTSSGEPILRVAWEGTSTRTWEALTALTGAARLVKAYIRRMRPARLCARWLDAFKDACDPDSGPGFEGVDDEDAAASARAWFMADD